MIWLVLFSKPRGAAWQGLIGTLFDRYRPERHYMRGPGPKWRAKNGGGPAARD